MESVHARNDSLTLSQRQAVEARGNVLVMAGAGTGKTHTLIERCLDCLCREGAALDEILVVTFTEAAATELKQRLRTALEAALGTRQSTLGGHLAEQLALFDTAPIGTLHSLCLRLVREHFYELGLDPQMAVLEPGEGHLLAEETLDEQFQSHYAGQTDFSMAVQNLIRVYGNGDERPIRAILLKLYHYAQTRPDAARWLAEQLGRFASPEPVEWREWLDRAIHDWRQEWLPTLEQLRPENPKAADCLEILKSNPKDILQKVTAADGDWARGTKKFREPLEDFLADAAFLQSLMPSGNSPDPLQEDWDWVRGHMAALLQLTQEFGRRFAERKRSDGLLDFHDLEQFALKLLWNFAEDRPTSMARRWRQKIRFVFVDEYQDINAAQDRIIQALSRDESWGLTADELQNAALSESAGGSQVRPAQSGNRFLVGDVKQSIYRFRLADPRIFREYARLWNGGKGQVISLTENFRSRESLLGCVNSIFERLMGPDIGGVHYDSGARLQFGRSEKRTPLSRAKDPSPRTELLLRFKGITNGTNADFGDGDLAELEETEKEARLIAYRLRELIAEGHHVWDEKEHLERPAQWRDMAVLLRAPASKAEAYAKEFERAGIPLAVERDGFYDSAEISDLLNLLKLLDNPLQDIPTIAVLRSPLVGLSLDELAEIRLAARNVRFWTALDRVRGSNSQIQNGTAAKILKFLGQFSRWRQLARQTSLSQCLETVLAETCYADWLRSGPRGPQRYANVERFINLAQQFDQFLRQGLFRFLKFVQAQQAADTEPEVAAVTGENAVRLMSIHQSKGLEFPIVVAADLAKPFNEQDLRGEIIFDETLGLCPRIKPPHTGGRYPSLPHWMARRLQRLEQRSEELRLLYVAMTRARDTLILTATISQKQWKTRWVQSQAITTRALAHAKSYADWLAMWFGVQNPQSIVESSTRGELQHLRWRIVEDGELAAALLKTDPTQTAIPELDTATADKLRTMLLWKYPFEPATTAPAKSSVTVLRRQAEERDEEAEQLFISKTVRPVMAPTARGKLSAAETGTAHHKFLQHISLTKAEDPLALAMEADRLNIAGILRTDERAVLDLEAIATFWNSDAGRRIRAQPSDCIKREWPFTACFSPKELDAIIGAETPPGLEDEFVIVQGVADLVVLLPQEIWLVDFKTDEITPEDIKERTRTYKTQLKLYADALSRIYLRRVTNCWLHFLVTRQTVSIEI